MDVMESVRRQQESPCYRVGPIELGDKRVVYLVRGAKGSVTYHDNGKGEHADINIHSLVQGTTNNKCMWNGDVLTHCDGRLCGRIEDIERMWITLESEYWCL
jgi:hypothetical protein